MLIATKDSFIRNKFKHYQTKYVTKDNRPNFFQRMEDDKKKRIFIEKFLEQY